MREHVLVHQLTQLRRILAVLLAVRIQILERVLRHLGDELLGAEARVLLRRVQ